MNANAGIEGKTELAGFLLVGVGGGRDGDGHVGELGLIRKDRGSGERGSGRDRGAAILNVGENPDGAIGGGAFRRSRRLGARCGGGWVGRGGVGTVEGRRYVGRAGDRGGDGLRFGRHHDRHGARHVDNHLVGSALAAAPADPQAGKRRCQQDVSRTLMPLHTHCLPRICVVSRRPIPQSFPKSTIILTP